MKLTYLLLALSLAALNTAFRGFNSQALKPGGYCKDRWDWETDFNKMKEYGFDSIRVFASSDCNTLAAAVPAALATGCKILATVWTQDDLHFSMEKNALLSAVRQYGFDWLAAVSVGSEDLYRKETTASVMIEKIHDVRGILQIEPNYSGILVGHVDTWNVWMHNHDLIRACDFVGFDGYPYFQLGDSNHVDNGANLFWYGVNEVRKAVGWAGSNAEVWITETGWPTRGPTYNLAVPSVQNAASYWQKVACSDEYRRLNTWWYSLQDHDADESFGVLDNNGNPYYDLHC